MGTVVTMLRLTTLLLLLLREMNTAASQQEFDADQCFLSAGLGYGTRKFLEDCEEIERFTTVPKPLTDSTSAFGVHSVICCPDQNIDPAALQEEEEYNYDSEYDSGDFYDYGGVP